jgi:MerR family copper efflux transcriptional regulator
MQIKEVAAKSGFSTGTLRYYEDVGLLPEPARTPAGYRSYDEDTLERLAFIARAKQLGCSLDEIVELTAAWEGGHCGPLQDRLRSLVAEKLVAAQAQIAELELLCSDLRRAADELRWHRPDGACDDRCGCVSEVSAAAGPAATVMLTTKPVRRERRRTSVGAPA